MGLWSAVKSWAHGEGKQGLDYLFVDEDVVAKDIETTKKLDELNQRELEDHSISDQDYRERLARLTNTAFPDYVNPDGETGRIFDQPELSPASGVADGLKEGANRFRDAISNVVTGSLGLTARLIPWQIWAAVIVYLLWLTSPWWLAWIGFKKGKR